MNSFAYFNKTYNNPRPLDIGTFELKRNFLHVQFSDKLKPLRIGPFKIINKISDITYEIVNQDGYTSHIHKNHLVPYHPKEPIIFPFIQKYNLHPINDDKIMKIIIHIIFLKKNNQLKMMMKLTSTSLQILIKKRIYHPQLTTNKKHLPNILHFRAIKKLIIPTQKTNPIFMITITILILEDMPMTDTISAHNREKIIDFSSVKRTYLHFLKILLKEG